MAEDTKQPITTERDGLGRFAPGNRGGPGGRRKMGEAELTMLGDAAPKSIQALIAALDAERTFLVGAGDNSRLETAPDHDARIKAANSLLDRLYGKPAQAVTGEDGSTIRIGVIVLPPESDD